MLKAFLGVFGFLLLILVVYRTFKGLANSSNSTSGVRLDAVEVGVVRALAVGFGFWGCNWFIKGGMVRVSLAFSCFTIAAVFYGATMITAAFRESKGSDRSPPQREPES